MDFLSRFILGIVCSALIAGIAYKRNSLSRSGTAGAMLVGTLIFGFGGWVWGALLISFFVLSTLLSHYKTAFKEHLSEKFDKGHQRDLGQTMANGGAGALIASVYYFYPEPIIIAAYAGAMATVNADTWATELGVLAKDPPRLITSLKKVDAGTSGGISVQGTLASLAGSLIIALLAALFLFIDGGKNSWQFFLPAAAGGLAGSLFDSFLGATVQVIYYSPKRSKETEKIIDNDGSPNKYQRGWRWLNNDWVNFISSLAGMAVAALVWLM
jgi:uncharacterized protein (TIGR00297 family)